jgi:hypothetical protein
MNEDSDNSNLERRLVNDYAKNDKYIEAAKQRYRLGKS